MARISTIKPEFFTSEDIVALSPFARLLYIALWCEADKEGRLVWKPKTFKMRYLPADDLDIAALCQELTAAGLVVLYGEGYALIPSFTAHQHINPRESASQIPSPDASTTRAPRVGTRQSRDSDAQGGREGKGREGIRDASRDDDHDSLFDEFWSAYPRKVGKDAARKAFAKRKADASLLASMVSAIASQGLRARCERGEEQYVPHPSTWLNEGRWQDEGAAVNDDPYGLKKAVNYGG
jgi:hypothetical protein